MLACCKRVEPEKVTSDSGDYEGTTDDNGDTTRKEPIAAIIVMAVATSIAITILDFSP